MLNKVQDSTYSIKWLKTRTRQRFVEAVTKIAAIVAMVSLTTPAAFAQSIDTGKIKQASQSIISAIQSICGIGVALLLVAGFGLFMWGVAPRHAL